MEEDRYPLFEDYLDEPLPDSFPAAFLDREEDSPHLVKVIIKSMKGIQDTDVQLSTPLTLLTGPNNSGKSTVIQAIQLAYDILRRCVNTQSWTLRKSGRAVQELGFLRVNQPRDLWFNQKWRQQDSENYIRVNLVFSNDIHIRTRIRFLYGSLNIGIDSTEPNPIPPRILKAIVSTALVFIPPSGGVIAHEPIRALAQLHQTLAIGDPGSIIRNILLHLQQQDNTEQWDFVCEVIQRYFGIELEHIAYDDRRDLEIRAPYKEDNVSIDLVSGGSGFSQILHIATIIAWMKPGIVLLDEPDSHLHPSLQTHLLDFLSQLADRYRMQVIICTHSKELIAQAPLSSIVPVSGDAADVKPLESIQHLLLEFERQGTISNVDLALLYQTKKCLFVEGETDKSVLRKVADHFGFNVFQGNKQIVSFDFKGVENLHLVPPLVELFKRMTGGELTWGVIRDRDANLDRVINGYRRLAEEKGIDNLLIWPFYSIENLFLSPSLIFDAVTERTPQLTLDVVRDKLEEITTSMHDEVLRLYISRAQIEYRRLDLGSEALRDSIDFVNGLARLSDRLMYYPGKKIFGQLVQWLQNEHGLNLRMDDLIEAINVDDPPEACREFLRLVSEMEND